MDEHAVSKKERSRENDERMWKLHILPKLGNKKVHAVTREDMTRLHKSMSGSPVNANRALSLLSTAFNLAEVWRMRPDGTNPCRLVKRNEEAARERFLTPDELGRLGKVLSEIEGENWTTPSIVPLIRLLILTGARLREIMHAKWKWFDEEEGLLRLPDSKTGQKAILLTPPALAVLYGIDRGDNPYIIAGRKAKVPLTNATKPWGRICERAKLRGVRLHDLRHSFGAAGAGSGLSLPMIAKLLHHKQLSTAERYAHVGGDPLRAAAETTAATLDGWMRGKEGAEVVEIEEAKK